MKRITDRNDRDDTPVITVSVCLLVVALVCIVFGQTIHDSFVNYDDNYYVYDSPFAGRGLGLSGVAWAFSHFHADNWHPLTTISHMLDVQLYGLQPWGHHLTNILLHATAAVLLFLALNQLTKTSNARPSTLNSVKERGSHGALRSQLSTSNVWASAFVATLFAIHPLRVESVAWVSERKDVLSGVFFGLTLLTYADYAHGLGKDRHSFRRYLTVAFFFALGLMCKPTLVTLPFVLLLLDYWPLRRWPGARSTEQGDKSKARSGKSQEQIPRVVSTPQHLNASTSARWSVVRSLVVEKVPLFILSAASCVVTIFAQKAALAAPERFPFHIRFANAVVSYIIYLGQLFFPAHLAVLYPYPATQISPGQIIAALVLLWAITTVVVIWRKSYPFLLTGWFWFIGMLVPMIGLVQVGFQPRADRYTYLPTIGLFILLAWGALALIQRFQFNRKLAGAFATLIVTVLTARAYFQTEYWHDTETLWRHAAELTSRNYIAHDSLGNALLAEGRLPEAITQYREAVAIRSDVAPLESNLGNALLREGQTDEAIIHFERAIRIDPGYAEAYNDMGSGLVKKDQARRAIGYYEKAIQLKPNSAEIHNNLGVALLEIGEVNEAIEHYKKAVAIMPASADVQCNLGNAFARKNNWDSAIAAYQAAIQARPDYAKAHNKLGVALEAVGRANEAFDEFQKALESDRDYAEAHCNLGGLLAQRGRNDEAIAHLREALRLKPDCEEARHQLQKLGVHE